MIYDKDYEKYYSVLFQYELDGSFTATHPEVPGCVGTGVTMSEALFRLGEARKIWMEAAVKIGKDIPIPDILKFNLGESL